LIHDRFLLGVPSLWHYLKSSVIHNTGKTVETAETEKAFQIITKSGKSRTTMD
jgi:hypothetical protein